MTNRFINFNEAAEFTGYSKSYLYKLTSGGIIPFSKPTGKKLVFDRDELEAFMRRNHSAGIKEQQTQAANYVSTTL